MLNFEDFEFIKDGILFAIELQSKQSDKKAQRNR